MFKHISKLFDYQELAGLMSTYERLQAGGQSAAAMALRGQIADLITGADSAPRSHD